jgi:hypothetical protein
MWSHRLAVGALSGVAPLFVGPAIAQSFPASVTIEPRAPGCSVNCLYLVNHDQNSRVVATLDVAPDQSFEMFDKDGNRTEFARRTIPVLLQAGERLFLADILVYERRTNPPTILRGVRVKYTVLGSYVPHPDLTELPRGRPEDSARLYERLSHDVPNTACGTGTSVDAPRLLVLRNMNVRRSIAVTWQNLRPDLSHEQMTSYLKPGEEVGVGCIWDWPVLRISSVRFSY